VCGLVQVRRHGAVDDRRQVRRRRLFTERRARHSVPVLVIVSNFARIYQQSQRREKRKAQKVNEQTPPAGT